MITKKIFVFKERMKIYLKKIINLNFIFILFMIILFSLSVYANNCFFYRLQEKNIRLLQDKDFPIFTINDKVCYGNASSHSLIPLILPNFNDNKYSHTIFFAHEVELDMKDMDVNYPLFLKIKTSFDSKGTIIDPNIYFVNSISLMQQNDYDSCVAYDINNMPQLLMNKEKKCFINVKFEVQETKILQSIVDYPQLFLVVEYDIVDENGKNFKNGTQTVFVNDIKQYA